MEHSSLSKAEKRDMPHFLAEQDHAPLSSCVISTRVRHRVSTVTIRDAILIWVRKGTKTLHSPHAAAEFKAGEVMVLAQGSQWDVVNDIAPHGRYEALVLQFGSDALRMFDDRHRSEFVVRPLDHYTRLGLDAQLEQGIQHAADGLLSEALSSRLKLHRVLEVLLMLAERGCVLPSEKEVTWPDKVRRLVCQRPHAEWSLARIGDFFHMSESTLRRRLAEFNTTAGELVREARMETALMLLQSTQLSVSEVAQRCGYDSHSRFTAAFRARYGYTPSYLR